MELSKIGNITELKEELGNELNRAATSFVRIGYLLKLARDTDILKDSSYSNVNEFASAEFGLDKTQVSRFIRINDRFAIGGYSETLKVEYNNYGSAKLSLMLTLPDEINKELSPQYSKSDIETIKAEYEAEQKISELEVMMEEPSDGPDEFLQAIVKELNDEHDDVSAYFAETIRIARKLGVEPNEADVKEAYMPDGDKTYSIRISGQGRFMINMKDSGMSIVNMRAPEEKSSLSWEEFKILILEDMATRSFPEPEKPKERPKSKKVEPAKPKENKYVEEVKKYHEQEEVAPVQPESVQEEAETDEKCTKADEKCTKAEENVQKAEENAQDENENVQEADIPAEVVEDPEDKPAAGDEEFEEKSQPQDEGDTAEEAQAAAGVEKVTLDAEDVLTSSQRDMLDWLDLIRRKVVPEDGSRPDWQGILDEIKTIERYVKQFTY